MAENKSYTIVEYFGGDSGYQCGYCKNSSGNFSHGMWSHTMTVQDYQDLIDRGWRRSGKYVYKPILHKTCCPQYTIRCHALKFQPSKSHKKILKKMSKFLSNGDLPKDEGENESMVCDVAGPREPSVSCRSEDKCPSVCEVQTESGDCPAAQGQRGPGDCPGSQGQRGPGDCPGSQGQRGPGDCPGSQGQRGPGDCPGSQGQRGPGDCPGSQGQRGPGDCPGSQGQRADTATESTSPENNMSVPPAAASGPKPGTGADPNRPLCRKAREVRKERRQQKEQQRQSSDGIAPTTTSSGHSNAPKSLEDFLSEGAAASGAAAHGLEVRLVRSNPPSPQFKASFDASYQVYKLYQMNVHKDPPEKPSESQFRRFLCDSPLEAEQSDEGPEMGYGSFHQQYWLDGKIVAVGVIDILPSCVSSVYLYYDPDFAALSLGSYSALREIAFTRQLQKQSPKLCFYYLGFYIHSCPKMRYKGQYRPSDLLCPETFTWVNIERCVPKLDLSRYSRFNPDPDAGDVCALRDVGRALVLHRRTVMPYAVYSRKRRGSSDEAEVKQFGALVGQDCAERILLYRN